METIVKVVAIRGASTPLEIANRLNEMAEEVLSVSLAVRQVVNADNEVVFVAYDALAVVRVRS